MDSLWQDIKRAPRSGSQFWLGWKPFTDNEGNVTSGVVPRIGMYDIGCQKWVSHFEDHGDPDGNRPMPYDPQPDYYCEGFIPPHPVK